MLIFFVGVLLPLVTYAQIKVTGSVKDEAGEPLSGTTVIQKGTSNGVITDQNGTFLISVNNENAVLGFTFLGYATQEIKVGTQRVLNVVMLASSESFDEVVVIGYGTRKKSDVTGSIISVSENIIKSRPVQNVAQALQGKAAGVDIVSNVRPGEVAAVTIRGNRSILAENGPLYVIDGVIMMGGSLNDINTNDIAHMEILKDASATAIYGSRGANGVVLITTKSGQKGQVQITYDGSLSLDNINSLTEWATAGESLDRSRQAYINSGSYKVGATAYTVPTKDADISMFGNSDADVIAAISLAYDADGNYDASKIPTTDWVDMLTRTGITQNHQVALSTGSENSKLYISLGYYDAKGVQLNQDYNRFTTRINGEVTPRKWITVGTNLNLARGNQSYGTINRSGSATGAKDLYGTALSQMVMAQPYDANGDYILYPGGNKTTPLYNPLIDLDQSEDRRKTVNIQANLFGEIRFTPWLKYRLNMGVGMNHYTKGTWQSSKSTLRRITTGAGASASYNTSESYQRLIENIVSFDKTFNKIHTVSATVMGSAQKIQDESSAMSASKIATDASKWYNLSANANGKLDSYSTGYTGAQLVSGMGRLSYSLMNRYLLTGTIRYDASSVLAVGHKWASFPSLSGAWKMQEEEFMQDLTWLNELKLRVGYGITGNSAIPAYTSMGPLALYTYVYGTTPAMSYLPFTMANPELSWEKTAQTNVGIDFSVLNTRVSGSLEYYTSQTSDLLMTRTIPAIVGYATIYDNVGKTQNNGVEVSLSTKNIVTKDFRWTTDLSWSHNEEKILELVNGKEDMSGNGWYIGQPIQVFRTYEVAGLWQNTDEDLAEIALWAANGYKFAPGQYKPIEQGTADHKLTDADKVIVGSNRPKWSGGMTNTFTYKDFEFSCFIYARIGQKYFSSLQPGGSTGGSYVGYVRKAGLDEFWSAEHTDAQWPQLYSSPALVSTTDVNQAMFINDGSFVSVRNASLSYNVPKKFIEKLDINRLQVYTQVLNPFLFGGKCVKNGINPDDTNGWTDVNSVGDPTGGTNNNTMMITSFVFGARITL